MSGTELAPGTRVLHVKRGNLECVVGIYDDAYAATPVHEIAKLVVTTMMREQMSAPGRADEPLPTDDTQLALRINGRDEALDPNLSLREQTEGYWTHRTLPVQAHETMTRARLPVCELAVVNVTRPAIYIS